MNEITPEQAINIIAQVAANFQATGKDHAVIQQAIQVVAKFLPKTEEKPEAK